MDSFKDKVKYCIEREPKNCENNIYLIARVWEQTSGKELDTFKKFADEGKYPLASIIATFLSHVPKASEIIEVKKEILEAKKKELTTQGGWTEGKLVEHLVNEFGCKDAGLIDDKGNKINETIDEHIGKD